VTTATTLTIAERVNAGAAWLDEHRPGWRNRIDIDTIDVASVRCCPLGQVYGASWCAPLLLHDGGQGTALGFYAIAEDLDLGADACLAEYAELTRAWRELILARRAVA
jgi:hypothetical protein